MLLPGGYTATGPSSALSETPSANLLVGPGRPPPSCNWRRCSSRRRPRPSRPAYAPGWTSAPSRPSPPRRAARSATTAAPPRRSPGRSWSTRSSPSNSPARTARRSPPRRDPGQGGGQWHYHLLRRQLTVQGRGRVRASRASPPPTGTRDLPTRRRLIGRLTVTDSDTAARLPVRLIINPRQRQPPSVDLLTWIHRRPEYRPVSPPGRRRRGPAGVQRRGDHRGAGPGLLPGLFNLLQSWVDQQRTEASIRIQTGDAEVELQVSGRTDSARLLAQATEALARRPGARSGAWFRARSGRRRLNRRRPGSPGSGTAG